jgi:Na+/proline symporter
MTDRQFLLTLRAVLVGFTLAALLFALQSKKTMYDMVQNAYTVTLVSAFVPLAAGIFWKRANNAGAILSAVLGLAAWLVADYAAAEATVPPPLVGLASSILGMVIGSLAARQRPRADSIGAPG